MPILLHNNENPYGPSPLALSAAQAALSNLHRYPDSQYQSLRNAIAQFWQLSPSQITVGNGSENILELVIKAFLTPTDNAIILPHTFLTIPFLLNLHHIPTRIIPQPSFYLDIDAILRAVTPQTRAIFLVNPNNPTGTYFRQHELANLIPSLPASVLIIIDEAYAEFALGIKDYGCANIYLKQHDNLIITRTFSKAYGLAGLRVGYAMSSGDIAARLNQIRVPFHVNHIASETISAALADQAHIKKVAAANFQGRQQLISGLEKLGLHNITEMGNFATFACVQAKKIHDELREHIVVKLLTDYGLPDFLRVTVGREEENQQFLAALARILI